MAHYLGDCVRFCRRQTIHCALAAAILFPQRYCIGGDICVSLFMNFMVPGMSGSNKYCCLGSLLGARRALRDKRMMWVTPGYCWFSAQIRFVAGYFK